MLDRRFRIAVISYYLPSDSKIGVGYQVHVLATELTRRGHDVVVFSPCPPVVGSEYAHQHLPLQGALRTFRFATTLRRIDFSSFDVLHAHGDDYWLWRRRVPAHIRTVHGSCFEEALRIRGAWERLRMVLLGFSELLASLVADETVVVSPSTRRWLPWVRRVIPNGVDIERFHPVPRSRSAHPLILFVGTWGGRKRGADLAAAFSRDVRSRLPTAELRMVSRDAPHGVAPGITVTGAVTDHELAEMYREAWVFCLPSKYEGFGIPYVEAMSSGTPVVATPNPGARYVTAEGQAGVLAKMDELGDVLVQILADQDVRDRLALVGRHRAAAEFSLTSVVNQYEKMYADVAERNAGWSVGR